jgi:hypothetical protein
MPHADLKRKDLIAEPTKAPEDVIVIDHIERPSEN